MKVSIITVTFNSAKYLTDCIDSVRSQDHPDIEHIIIDGMSTDGTVGIIRRNKSHISTWISEPDRGMYDAINKGIDLATGDIIGILNSDDMFASADVISQIVKCFKETGTDSVYGDLVYVHPENTSKVFRYWKGLPYNRARFKTGWMPAHPTFYIKRSLIEEHGTYENHYFTAAEANISSLLRMPIMSPVARSIPLLIASYIPWSGSDIHAEIYDLFLRIIPAVPSVDIPSMIICSMSG